MSSLSPLSSITPMPSSAQDPPKEKETLQETAPQSGHFQGNYPEFVPISLCQVTSLPAKDALPQQSSLKYKTQKKSEEALSRKTYDPSPTSLDSILRLVKGPSVRFTTNKTAFFNEEEAPDAIGSLQPKMLPLSATKATANKKERIALFSNNLTFPKLEKGISSSFAFLKKAPCTEKALTIMGLVKKESLTHSDLIEAMPELSLNKDEDQIL